MEIMEIDLHMMQGMCFRKKKLSYKIANKIAQQYNQRPYCCPICQHWHCTKQSESDFLQRLQLSNIEVKSYEIAKHKPNKTKSRYHLFSSQTKWSKVPIDKLLEVASLLGIEIQPIEGIYTNKTKSPIINKIQHFLWKSVSDITLLNVFRVLKDSNCFMEDE
jgi:hypothetical protein